MLNRVVITGIGVVTPVGIGQEKFWEALRTGSSGIDRITLFDAIRYATQIAAEVKDFKPEDFIPRQLLEQTGRFAQFVLAATREAIVDAGLVLEKENSHHIGISIGTSRGGVLDLEEECRLWQAGNREQLSSVFLTKYFPHSAATAIAVMLGTKGPNNTVMAACASGTMAIGNAFRILQRGDVDVIIAGGTEAPITPLLFAGACSTKAMSERNDEPLRACRPFEKNRDGYVMGEGAGVVILETLIHALNRGAKIYGEITGYGLTCDAYHITAPDPSGKGLARAMSDALTESKLLPSEVDYLNAHGTSTFLNDKCETLAIKQVFGSHAYSLPISSTKSMTGHLMGATGAVELIACILTMENSLIPPTTNYEVPDPDCDLYYVPNQAIKSTVLTAMSNSLGFGGHNASLVLKKYYV